tara:strand:- start:35 stop:217 length:183 start_codon:yes stop_codon:yes gene_type:complete
VVLAVVAVLVEVHQVVDHHLITLLVELLTLEAVEEEDQLKVDIHHMLLKLKAVQVVLVLS